MAVVVVFKEFTGAHETPPFTDCSHPATNPVSPLIVTVPPFEPVQSPVVTEGESVPPTEAGVTVIVPVAFAVPQPPVKGIL